MNRVQFTDTFDQDVVVDLDVYPIAIALKVTPTEKQVYERVIRLMRQSRQTYDAIWVPDTPEHRALAGMRAARWR